MKKIIPLIIFLTLTSSVFAWPFGKKNTQPKPSPTPSQVVEPVKPTPSGGREILSQLKNELVSAKQENAKLKQSLDSVKSQLQIAKDETLKVQKDADILKEWGIVQQAEAQKFMEKYNAAVKRYHRLKLIAAFIAAGVGVLLGLQFMNLAPPPYNLGVPVGGAALFAALVWFLL